MIELLLLIIVANGTPVVANYLLKHRMSWPVDFGFKLADNKPCFGPHKTWRGLILALFVTSGVALLLNIELITGLQVAALAMAGDLVSSFLKRRIGMASGSRFVLLDQVPESFLPAWLLMSAFNLNWIQVFIVLVSFVILEIILSLVFYKLGVRKHPY